MPNREQVKDFLRAALMFHQIANEEIFINDLIESGDKLLDENKYNDAI